MLNVTESNINIICHNHSKANLIMNCNVKQKCIKHKTKNWNSFNLKLEIV